MKVNDSDYKWNGTLSKRQTTKYIILHHRAGDGDSLSIHRSHLLRGWCGIGYHFYVRKDGSVYRGRPIGTIGAHATGYNDKSIGVCFEGNFETETEMSGLQKRAGKELITYLKGLYPKAEIKKHRDVEATACPGNEFPFDEIKRGVTDVSVEEAVEILQAKIGLEDVTIDFLLCYKYGEELVVKLAEAII